MRVPSPGVPGRLPVRLAVPVRDGDSDLVPVEAAVLVVVGGEEHRLNLSKHIDRSCDQTTLNYATKYIKRTLVNRL